MRAFSSSPRRNAACRLPAGHGFTLIELLTVIAIIAVLAGITLGLTSAARNARTNARATAEIQQLRTAIERYKSDRALFPRTMPYLLDRRRRWNPVVNQLFYELRGVDVVDGAFRVKGERDALQPETVKAVFGRGGFLNASADPSEPSKTYLEMKASSVSRVSINGANVDLLVTAFPWPVNAPEAPPLAAYGEKSKANPWRYVSTSATNNPGGYDLWMEVWVGSEKRVYKNW